MKRQVDALDEMLARPEGLDVLVVGLGRSGIAAASRLASAGANVSACDTKPLVDGAEELRNAGVNVIAGRDGPELLESAELVVLSPGVWLSHPLVQAARRGAIPVIGELELAWRLLRQRYGSTLPMIAVTGTNGKSTTTALCAHLLEYAGLEVFCGGNIGNPLTLALDVPALDACVVEVSSFQLEHLSSDRALDPRVAVWLNLTPDHIDRHGSVDEYARAKTRLFLGQREEDLAVLNADDENVWRYANTLPARVQGFGHAPGRSVVAVIDGRRISFGDFELEIANPRLRGLHNSENCAAAVLAAREVTGECAGWLEAVQSYPGLPHRLQTVGFAEGVEFIDDSKATNVDATMKSLTGFDEPVVLIAGGRGKGSGFERLRKAVSERVKRLVLIGEQAKRMAADLEGCAPAVVARDMDEAVRLAFEAALPDGVVLLSPACASFDMFRDYAHRGEVFARAVAKLADARE